jgi:PIN domain nuclease of toxin-antitoxin system
MKLLLDTHVWLWTLVSPEKITPNILMQLGDPENELYLSAASAWEIAIKYSLGKLPLPEPPAQFVPSRLSRDGVIALPIEPAHALAVADLPQHHNDPFDRLLVVQARLEQMTLVSADTRFADYEVDRLLV